MLGKRGGWIHDFPSEISCLRVLKLFVRELFRVVSQKSSGGEKVSGRDGAGEYQDFPSKVFVSNAENFRTGNFLSCVSETFR